MRLGKPGTAAEIPGAYGLIGNMEDYNMKLKSCRENTELMRTETNSGNVSSYRVRNSSVLRLLFAPVPEDAPPPRNRTRMTRIGRIFTDIHDPCVSVSSVPSMSYHNSAIIDEDK